MVFLNVMHTYNINSQYCAPLIQFDWPGPVGLARGATKKKKITTTNQNLYFKNTFRDNSI